MQKTKDLERVQKCHEEFQGHGRGQVIFALLLLLVRRVYLALLVGDEVLLHSSTAVHNDFVHSAHDKRTDNTECKLTD